MVGVSRPMTEWRVVIWFGLVSLTADMVYEGARSMYGPLLASLGATARRPDRLANAGRGHDPRPGGR